MPPPATLRYAYGAAGRRGRPEAYPKGRPNPQDPKGGAGATSRHPAPRRDESARRPTRQGRPTVKKVTGLDPGAERRLPLARGAFEPAPPLPSIGVQCISQESPQLCGRRIGPCS